MAEAAQAADHQGLAVRATRMLPASVTAGTHADAVPWPDDGSVRRDGRVHARVLLDDPLYAAAKRVFDVAFALLLLALTTPLLLMAAALIWLTSPGPVVFRQTRCARGGQLFTCYKLRTMVDGAERRKADILALNEATGPVFKVRNDPRVTWIGHWLRRTSVDELPQLVNVLRGDMSIVGPRPPIPDEVAQYKPWEVRRLAVKPGLTCLWQVSGRSEIGFEQWVAMDLEYIRRRSFWYDMQIVARTAPAVISGRGAL